MKITNDGMEITHSGTYIIKSEGDITFQFDDVGNNAKVRLSFINDDNINDGKRMAESVPDEDGKGITLKLQNYTSIDGEGVFPKRYKLYESSKYTYSIMFITNTINKEARSLTVTFFKEKKE